MVQELQASISHDITSVVRGAHLPTYVEPPLDELWCHGSHGIACYQLQSQELGWICKVPHWKVHSIPKTQCMVCMVCVCVDMFQVFVSFSFIFYITIIHISTISLAKFCRAGTGSGLATHQFLQVALERTTVAPWLTRDCESINVLVRKLWDTPTCSINIAINQFHLRCYNFMEIQAIQRKYCQNGDASAEEMWQVFVPFGRPVDEQPVSFKDVS